jgi:hypothetical protein
MAGRPVMIRPRPNSIELGRGRSGSVLYLNE